ncbi:LOW QUALITY PROTEIN: mitochondria-eating protein [Plectropomus leopardus]|uniref:LOW QUALITY PROTEIN: mitochondria-eating protein n=1 Tax=Plectropomus leopardus TaxID=160734 RepID=UPI001C4D0C8F|nr:LOW QUALITY PROTEIN: mitochondria-eating protein [Plectropomus leopardus]
MADTLRRLTNTSSYSVLQDKLESWHKDYHVISCDQNLNRCCELIELTAKIQGQLFAILNLTAAEGGHYAGVDTLKTRLLPWLGTCFSMARPSVTDNTSLQLMQDSVEKDMRIRELSASHESDMLQMDTQLCSTRLQLDSVRAELVNAQKQLDETKSKSATTLLATEDEILQLKADLRSAHEQVEIYKRKLETLDYDYERQIRLLKDEVSTLSMEKAMLQERLVRSRSPSPLPRPGSSPLRSESPTRAQLTNSSRYARLVSRFSDLYAVERLEAQTMLRRHIVDLEMVQKIIFIAVVESFKTAKLAYRQFKLRVRKTLSTSHFGPETLEDAAVDYMVRNLDLYDVQSSVNDVINAMNVNPRISFPPEVDFALITSLIRETCRVAFAMQTLDPQLDLAFASDGELYSDSKYRRSYDSEFTAPLVMYHVWPALVEGDAVVVKGEAVTRRGALWSRSRSSVSPVRSRSLSPTRSLAFNSKRSLSPERLTASRL